MLIQWNKPSVTRLKRAELVIKPGVNFVPDVEAAEFLKDKQVKFQLHQKTKEGLPCLEVKVPAVTGKEGEATPLSKLTSKDVVALVKDCYDVAALDHIEANDARGSVQAALARQRLELVTKQPKEDEE